MIESSKKPSIMALLSLICLLSSTAASQDIPQDLMPVQQRTFPLLSHHHVVSRHLSEISQSSDNSNNSGYAKIHQDIRPPLRRLAHQQLSTLYQGYGTHYIDLWVGYPAQRQTLVVDTGSSVTAFPCADCEDCGKHADSPFAFEDSESFRVSPCTGPEGRPCTFGQCDLQSSEGGTCQIVRSYGDSGWEAYEAQDVAYAGGLHDRSVTPVDGEDVGEDPKDAASFSFILTFGCQTKVNGYFAQQLASGVMGLDRRAQSFWGQMRSQRVIDRAVFGLCFVRQPIASRGGTTAGAVTLGGIEEGLNDGPMVYAKTMVTDNGGASFKLRVRKMYLRESGGTSVMYDGKAGYHQLDVEEETLNGGDGMFDIDSGTTDTYFIKGIGEEFRKVWKEIVKSDYTNEPVKLSDQELRKLPTMILQMVPHEGGVGDEVSFQNPAEIKGLAGKVDYGTPNDILFAIPAVHYMQHNADGTYTARIYLDRDDSAGNILGANAMMGHNVLFDIDAGRIGFAESECDYARLVAEATGGASPARSGEVTSESSTMTNSESAPPAASEICGSLKCKGFMGITCTVFFLLFFIFARRYVTKRDDIYESEFEMKSSRTSNGRGGGYSDDEDSYASSRASYRDRAPPTSYSDDHRRSGSNDRSGRHHHNSSNNSHSSGHRRSGSGDRSQTSSGSRQSSSRNPQSMSGSIQSQHSSRTSRSHQSSQSNRTSSSYRSSGERSSHSKGSQGSGGSRGSKESHRSHRSGTSHRSNRSDRDRYYDRDQMGGSRRDRYYDDDEEISRPPSIS